MAQRRVANGAPASVRTGVTVGSAAAEWLKLVIQMADLGPEAGDVTGER